MEKISTRIKQALELKNLTQADIVKRTGIPKGSISQYISGHVEPKQDRIYLIAKALGVREAWLIGYDVPMDRTDRLEDNFSNSTLEAVVEIAKLLDDKQLKMLLKFAKAIKEEE